MTQQKSDPIETVTDILAQRYPDAQYAILTGSVAEGKAHAKSDLDLLIVYDFMPFICRESFTFIDWDVEAFCVDIESLAYLLDTDHNIGIAAYCTMVLKGRAIPAENEDFHLLKRRAAEIMKKGPKPLDETNRNAIRYKISSLCDYIRAASSREAMIASAASLYGMLADFYLRSRGHYSGTDKGLAKRLAETAPEFYAEYNAAFDKLFRDSEFEGVIQIAEKVLEPTGGFLFEGYKRNYPESWRVAVPEKMKKAG